MDYNYDNRNLHLSSAVKPKTNRFIDKLEALHPDHRYVPRPEYPGDRSRVE